MRCFGFALLVASSAWTGLASAAGEETVDIRITIQDHRFSSPGVEAPAGKPLEIAVPAGKPVRLIVKNEDKTAEEVESLALRFEKVIKGGGEMTFNVKPLKPGRYKFFGEYHADTAVGYLVAK